MLRATDTPRVFNSSCKVNNNNRAARLADHIFVNHSGIFTDIKNNKTLSSVSGVTSAADRSGMVMSGNGSAGYTLDTSGTGGFYDAITDRTWITYFTREGIGSAPQGIWSEGAAANGLGMYYRTATHTIQLEVRRASTTEFTNQQIFDSIRYKPACVAISIRNSTSFACYVNGVQKHTATLGGQIASHSADPRFFTMNANIPQGGGPPVPWEGNATYHLCGNFAASNVELAQWSKMPMSIFRNSVVPFVFDEPAAGGLSIPIAAYHRRQFNRG